MPIYRAVNTDFFKSWSASMAYILGFFAADGSMGKNSRGACFWSIQITDRDLLVAIRKAVGSNHTISVRPKRKNHRTLYRLQIGSKDMYADLFSLGFRPQKTKHLAVPRVSQKYFADFVRGYFDGDGNVWSGFVHTDRKKKTRAMSVSFTSVAKPFLSALYLRLKKAGLSGGALRVINGRYYRLTYSIRDALKLYGFMYNTNRLDSRSIFLDRKKRVFERFIRMRS